MTRALAALILLLAGPAVQAEKYLSRSEAEKLCFPGADRFEQQVLRFSPDRAKKIERAAGTRLLASGIKVTQAWKGDDLLGVVFFDHVIGKHELIDYAVALTPGGEVSQIEVLEYRESYGGEIRGSRWREQFVGKKKGDKVQLNQDVYNISGATMSCRHVTEGVKRVLAIFDVLCRPEFASAGWVPAAESGTR